MTKAPYMPLAKFDKLQEAMNKIQQGAMRLSARNCTPENKEEATEDLLNGLRGLSDEHMKLMREFDERLHKLEP